MNTQESISPANLPVNRTPSAPPNSVAAKVRVAISPQCQSERISRMSAKHRELYERIRKHREQMNSVDFSLVAAVREIRANG